MLIGDIRVRCALIAFISTVRTW